MSSSSEYRSPRPAPFLVIDPLLLTPRGPPTSPDSTPSPISSPTTPDPITMSSQPSTHQPTAQSLQAQIDQLFAQLHALPASGTTVAATSQAAPAPNKYKANLPDVFNGDVTLSKSFKRQLTIYFSARGNEFDDYQAKILFLLSYMRGGNAGPWAD